MSALFTVCAGVAGFMGALGGFGALSLAMDRHWEGRYGRGAEPGRLRPWLQLGGGAGLLLSLLACLQLHGPTQGWVLWFGMLTAGAIALVLVLSYGPRHTVRLAAGAGAAALAAAIAAALLH